MSIVEEFCTDILILDRGITKLKGNLINIKNEYSDSKLEVITIKNIDEIRNHEGHFSTEDELLTKLFKVAE